MAEPTRLNPLPSEPHRALLRVAERQEGLITQADAVAAGLTADQIRHRVRSGRWERLAPGVWKVGGAPTTWTQQLRAGLLWLGDEARISGLAAGQLLRFDNFDRDRVEFLGPPHFRGRRGPFEVHTTDHLPLIDRTNAQGFPVTSASRTIVDLAARGISPRLLGNAIETAIRTGLTSEAFLKGRLEALRGRGRAGVRLLDSVMRDAGGHTQLEREFLRLMREGGLPKPSCQVTLMKDGTTIARADFQFKPWPLVVEVNGRKGHASDEDREKDALRNNELVSEGFTVLTFVTRTVERRPDYVVDRVRGQLRLMGAPV